MPRAGTAQSTCNDKAVCGGDTEEGLKAISGGHCRPVSFLSPTFNFLDTCKRTCDCSPASARGYKMLSRVVGAGACASSGSLELWPFQKNRSFPKQPWSRVGRAIPA